MGTPVTAPLTGGLIDFFRKWGGVGFFFDKFTRKTKSTAAVQLAEKVEEAAKIFWEQPQEWDKLIVKAANVNVSWKPRVRLYMLNVYYASLRRVRGEAWWRDFSANIPPDELLPLPVGGASGPILHGRSGRTSIHETRDLRQAS